MSFSTISAPASPSPRARVWPIPCPEPVIRARLPRSEKRLGRDMRFGVRRPRAAVQIKPSSGGEKFLQPGEIVRVDEIDAHIRLRLPDRRLVGSAPEPQHPVLGMRAIGHGFEF